MRESRTPGSVREAVSNHRPYRDHSIAAQRAISEALARNVDE